MESTDKSYIVGLLQKFYAEMGKVPVAERLFDPEFHIDHDYEALIARQNEETIRKVSQQYADEEHANVLDYAFRMTGKAYYQNALKITFATLIRDFQYYKKLMVDEKVYQMANPTVAYDLLSKLHMIKPESIFVGGNLPTMPKPSSRLNPENSFDNFFTFIFLYTHHINDSYINLFLHQWEKDCLELYARVLGEEEAGDGTGDGTQPWQKDPAAVRTFLFLLTTLRGITDKSLILETMLASGMKPLFERVIDVYFRVWYKVKAMVQSMEGGKPDFLSQNEWWLEHLSPEDSEEYLEHFHTNSLAIRRESIADYLEDTLIGLRIEGPPALEQTFLHGIVYRVKPESPGISPHVAQFTDYLLAIRDRYTPEDLAKQCNNIDLYSPLFASHRRGFTIKSSQKVLAAYQHDYLGDNDTNYEVIMTFYFRVDAASAEFAFYTAKIIDILRTGHAKSFFLYLKRNEEIFLTKALNTMKSDFVRNYIDLVIEHDLPHLSEYVNKIPSDYKHIQFFVYLIDGFVTGQIQLEDLGNLGHIHMIVAITDYFHMLSKGRLGGVMGNITSMKSVVQTILLYFEMMNASSMRLPSITQTGTKMLSDAHMVITQSDERRTVLEALYLAVQTMIYTEDAAKLEKVFCPADHPVSDGSGKGAGENGDSWKSATHTIFTFIFSMFNGSEIILYQEDDEGEIRWIRGKDPMLDARYVESMLMTILEFNMRSDVHSKLRCPKSGNGDHPPCLKQNQSLHSIVELLKADPVIRYQINWARILGVIETEKVRKECLLIYHSCVIDYFRETPIIWESIGERAMRLRLSLPKSEIEVCEKVAGKITFKCQHCDSFWCKPQYRHTGKLNLSHMPNPSSYQMGNASMTNLIRPEAKTNLAILIGNAREIVNLPVFYICHECDLNYHDFCYYGLIPRNTKRIVRCAVCESKKFGRYKLNDQQLEYIVYHRILCGNYFG